VIDSAALILDFSSAITKNCESNVIEWLGGYLQYYVKRGLIIDVKALQAKATRQRKAELA
jgi:hypothetical protein